jgi:hypothetical protein
MTKFADQLFVDLMRDYDAALGSLPPERRLSGDAAAAASARKRRHRAVRPAWLTAGTAAATGAVAAGFVLFGGQAAPAYAVTKNADGTVSVAVHQLSALDAANSRLKVLGERVAVVPIRKGCPGVDWKSLHEGFLSDPNADLVALGPFSYPADPAKPRGSELYQPGSLTREGPTRPPIARMWRESLESLTVDARNIPVGETLLLGIYDEPKGIVISGAVPVLAKGEVPRCIELQGEPGARPVPGDSDPGTAVKR